MIIGCGACRLLPLGGMEKPVQERYPIPTSLVQQKAEHEEEDDSHLSCLEEQDSGLSNRGQLCFELTCHLTGSKLTIMDSMAFHHHPVEPFITGSVFGGMAIGPPGDVGNRAVNTSTPSSVTSRVCSNWAVRLPSTVTLVQSSGHVLSRYEPRLIIGSMVKHIPAFAVPTALFLA